jgi:hypothetical protein
LSAPHSSLKSLEDENATMHIQDCFGLFQRKACKFLAAARSTVRYVVSKTKDDQLLEAKKSVVSKYPRADHLLGSVPGKPADNCFIESFNGTLRNECLNVYYFPNISEAKRIIEEWRIDYNKKRPQKRFKGLTPFEYRNKLLAENLI